MHATSKSLTISRAYLHTRKHSLGKKGFCSKSAGVKFYSRCTQSAYYSGAHAEPAVLWMLCRHTVYQSLNNKASDTSFTHVPVSRVFDD